METFYVSHHSGQCLASNVNEETVRKILRNVGPIACRVGSETEPDEEINGVEWLIDNPGN